MALKSKKLAGRFSTIVIDPPWPLTGGKNGKAGWSKTVAADAHYPVMSLKEIAALPISNIAKPDAHLYLWTTNFFLPKAFELLNTWGFRYVTCITWGKTTGYGIGQYYRGATEHCLFAVRGRVPYSRDADGGRLQGTTLVLAPRGKKHSAKPEKVTEYIEEVSPLPRVELFARRKRDGWLCLGDELGTVLK